MSTCSYLHKYLTLFISLVAFISCGGTVDHSTSSHSYSSRVASASSTGPKSAAPKSSLVSKSSLEPKSSLVSKSSTVSVSSHASSGGGSDEGSHSDVCKTSQAARAYLENSCGNSACHGGGTFPLLKGAGFQALVTLTSQLRPKEQMVVPGFAKKSWLYKKVAGTQGAGGGALMPLGAASPEANIQILRKWINDGANTDCGSDTPKTSVTLDPNTLDQTQLFSCVDPSLSRSSPARIRRILGDEYSRASQYRKNDVQLLEASAGTDFSTDTSELSLDPDSIELLFLTRGKFLTSWVSNDLSKWRRWNRLQGIHKNVAFECIFKPNATSQCRDDYVDLILKKRALFRDPTTEESALIREVLDHALSEDGLDRKQALSRVVFTASLLPGALFRSELGDDKGRLTAQELASALGHVLSPFPVGAPFYSTEYHQSDPDADDRALGRFTAIQKAALDGSIFEPEVRKALIRKYASGVSAERPDLVRTHNKEIDSQLSWRGNYWLAPNIRQFFQQWLDYDEISFKGSPARTSKYEDVFGITGSYLIFVNESGLVHSRKRGRQPMHTEALDDVIARVVVETDKNGNDVFRELMTTDRFMLPANKGSDIPLLKSNQKKFTMIYNVDELVSKDPDERWKHLPERTGVLTHPAWLGAHGDAFEDGPSLVLRGKWIRERLFSQSVPSLALVMVNAQLAASHPDINARTRVARATEQGPKAQSCIGCHKLMNSLGLPFEAFNHAGYVRSYDRGGKIDSSTVINNLPDPALNRRYATGREFLTALGASAYARRGFIRQAFRYFTGRAETLSDSCTLSEMEAALDETGSFIRMLEALVATETFSHRSVGVEP